jgi:hypothetical protein
MHEWTISDAGFVEVETATLTNALQSPRLDASATAELLLKGKRTRRLAVCRAARDVEHCTCTAVAYFDSNLHGYCAWSGPSTLGGPSPSAHIHSTVMVGLEDNRCISWSSAFEDLGSPSDCQSSTPGVSYASCAAADAATAAPAHWPTVSADRMAELALTLLKSTAPAGVKWRHAELLARVLAGGTPNAVMCHRSIRRRRRRQRRPTGNNDPGRCTRECPSLWCFQIVFIDSSGRLHPLVSLNAATSAGGGTEGKGLCNDKAWIRRA